MNAYKAIFRIQFTNSLQYRAAALAGLGTQFVWGFMYVLAFRAFYASNPAAFPMTFEQTVSYIWIQQAFLALYALWAYDYGIFDSIESGQISYELARPLNLYNRWFTQAVSNRMARAFLRCAPILLVAFILPAPFRLVLPADAAKLGIFFVSLLLATGVTVGIVMLVYVSAFSTLNAGGTRMVLSSAGEFLAGGYIPVPFFPEGFRRVVELSPFGAMQNTPLLIYSGYLTDSALVQALALQVFWLAALVLAGRLLMKRALGRVIVQGG
ncbi:MAG: ABC transporter permease [Defluviitaleaceae bacterium]|nr:ABC transporter permease [Defluviitaleaceae bacterium]